MNDRTDPPPWLLPVGIAILASSWFDDGALSDILNAAGILTVIAWWWLASYYDNQTIRRQKQRIAELEEELEQLTTPRDPLLNAIRRAWQAGLIQDPAKDKP